MPRRPSSQGGNYHEHCCLFDSMTELASHRWIRCSDVDGEKAATMYSLTNTAKLKRLDPWVCRFVSNRCYRRLQIKRSLRYMSCCREISLLMAQKIEPATQLRV